MLQALLFISAAFSFPVDPDNHVVESVTSTPPTNQAPRYHSSLNASLPLELQSASSLDSSDSLTSNSLAFPFEYNKLQCTPRSAGSLLIPDHCDRLALKLFAVSKSVTIAPGSMGWHDGYRSCQVHVFPGQGVKRLTTEIIARHLLGLRAVCEQRRKHCGGAIDAFAEHLMIELYTYVPDSDDQTHQE